jgi:hypothetical protein
VRGYYGVHPTLAEIIAFRLLNWTFKGTGSIGESPLLGENAGGGTCDWIEHSASWRIADPGWGKRPSRSSRRGA